MKISVALLTLVGVALASPTIFRRADECPPCDYVCIQSYPESCYCARDAELQCAKENPCHVAKVGDCPPLEDNKLSAPADEPVCDYVCTLQYPEGCYCQNREEQKCAETIPGYVPKLKDCPPLENTKLAAPADEPVCDYVCTQQYPEGCYCQNEEEQKCAEQHPGYVPKIKDCPIEAPSKRAVKYQTCGTRGQPACPSGTECREDPFASCGLACDEPGYCIPTPTEQCGGFAGFACSDPNQVCVDEPGDDCDPENGGADCIGYCFSPQE